jgi:hypothetical protein
MFEWFLKCKDTGLAETSYRLIFAFPPNQVTSPQKNRKIGVPPPSICDGLEKIARYESININLRFSRAISITAQ